MLEDDYPKRFAALMDSLECIVAVPASMMDTLRRPEVEGPVYDERRRYMRRRCVANAVVELLQNIPSIPRTQTFNRVLTKDISRSGMGFLHSEQLYPGEQVWMWLPTSKLRCRVARCRRHNSQCFEVGVVFDEAS